MIFVLTTSAPNQYSLYFLLLPLTFSAVYLRRLSAIFSSTTYRESLGAQWRGDTLQEGR